MNFGPVAGIDVSKRFSDMCILSPDNKIFAQEKIYHDETSINRANTLLQKAEQIFSSKPVIVMESTSHYHLILFQFFSEHGYEVIGRNYTPFRCNCGLADGLMKSGWRFVRHPDSIPRKTAFSLRCFAAILLQLSPRNEAHSAPSLDREHNRMRFQTVRQKQS